ncbi:Abortive bacteriophage infection, resistance [Mycobacteriaceae bacterium]
MQDGMEGFLLDLEREISLNASLEGSEQTLPEAFTEYMFEVLTDAGEIDGATAAAYQGTAARASGFTLNEDESTLWLFLSDYRAALEPQNLGKSELDAHFRRMTGFMERARDGLWKKLEESAPSWDMAQRLAEVWPQLAEIRLVVLTNAVLKTSVPESGDLEGRRTHYSVWDLTRLYQLATSGRAQEPISIDVVDIWGEAIPCLGPHGETDSYDAYLAMLPGDFIAKIYETFGPRLLELNVRSFLQSRGKVNRGIQQTIKQESGRFLAYNNGISMTAAKVRVVDLPSGGRGIASIEDLQIVNGGQTTASLHFAKVKNKADLSAIYVQAKLSVVEPALLMELVPRISEYANSQNKVNMADFSANDPFHVEIEKLSRTVWAPGKAGTGDMTRWFYERARGQYADAIARERTPARQRQFKVAHPLNQKFTKTDLAKFENTWDQMPWTVSLGAEKNFREFMLRLEKRGKSFKPDQLYFENLSAKAILFRSSQKLIDALQLGGYRSQTVTYTLAKLLHATGQRVDLKAIWRSQELSPALARAVEDLAPLVHKQLLKSAGSKNVSEWAKKEESWQAVLDVQWKVPASLSRELAAESGRTQTTSTSSIGEHLTESEQAELNAVMSMSGESWKALSSWAKQTSSLQPWQRSLAFSLGTLLVGGRIPSRKQAAQGALILSESKRLGFEP